MTCPSVCDSPDWLLPLCPLPSRACLSPQLGPRLWANQRPAEPGVPSGNIPRHHLPVLLASPEGSCEVGHGPTTPPAGSPDIPAHPHFSPPPRVPLSPGSCVPGCESPCPRCGKEAWRLQLLHEGILSIREAQQELHRWAMLGGPAGAPGQRAGEPEPAGGEGRRSPALSLGLEPSGLQPVWLLGEDRGPLGFCPLRGAGRAERGV